MDTLFSIAGIYVGQMGLNSVQTLSLDTVKKYFQALTLLALGCICMRILWVVDIIYEAEDAVKQSREHTFAPTPVKGNANDDLPIDKPLSSNVTVTLGIQVRNGIPLY